MGRRSRYEGLTLQQALLASVRRVVRRRGLGACWEWLYGKDGRGYGWLTFGGTKMSAHRAAFIAFKGEPGEGKNVLHRCDNPACINPEHLYDGTQGDNMRDTWQRGRFRMTPKFRQISAERARDARGRWI